MTDPTTELRERLRDAAKFLRYCRGTEPAEYFEGHAETCEEAASPLSRQDGEEGYFYLVTEDGRKAPLSWQEVAAMCRSAGHDVMVQPGFRRSRQDGEPHPAIFVWREDRWHMERWLPAEADAGGAEGGGRMAGRAVRNTHC